jgi:hypothetical protein
VLLCVVVVGNHFHFFYELLALACSDVELNSDDRMRLACLRTLLAMCGDERPREAFVRAHGLRRVARLFVGASPAPIQLLAVAICAQTTTPSSSSS